MSMHHEGGPHVVHRDPRHEHSKEREHTEDPEHAGKDHPDTSDPDDPTTRTGQGGINVNDPGTNPAGLETADNPLLGGDLGGDEPAHHRRDHEPLVAAALPVEEGGTELTNLSPYQPMPGAPAHMVAYNESTFSELGNRDRQEAAAGFRKAHPRAFAGLIAFGVLGPAALGVTLAGAFTKWFGLKRSAVRFTSTPDGSATVGTEYTSTVTTEDDVSGRTRALTAPTAPSWLGFTDKGDGTGVLRGTPTGAGMDPVKLTVAAGGDTEDFGFVITAAAVSLTFFSKPGTKAIVGVEYRYQPTLSGSTASATITASGLPAWLAPTGGGPGDRPYVVSGTPPPEAVGAHTFTLTATDDSATATQSVTVAVDAMKPAPSITFTSRPLMAAFVGRAYSYDAAAETTDGSKPQIRLVNDPRWLRLTDNGDGTASLSGAPTSQNVGDNEVVLAASPVDDPTTGASQTFTVRVTGMSWEDLLDGNRQLVAAIQKCLETLEAMSEDEFWAGAIAAVGQGSLPSVDQQGVPYGRMPYPVQQAVAQMYLNAARLGLVGERIVPARDRAGEGTGPMKVRLRREAGGFPAMRATPDPDPVRVWTAASKLAAIADASTPPLKKGDPLPRAVKLEALFGVLTDYLK